MKIYNYHPLYKYFVSCTDADESPLEPGVFLIPAHATTIELPNCEENEIQVFIDNDWKIIVNHIGIYYNKTTQQPFEWYDPFTLPLDGTKKVPPEPEDGFIIQWENDDWVVLESKEGIYYNISNGIEINNTDPFNEPPNSTKQPPPQAPDGYGITWDNGWKLIEIPKPPILTPQQKLEQAGLTVEELKELLGLS